MTTTCQICGRAIKSKNGLIAHHGYKRPGQGWQTSSCFGARFRPYEVACDALPIAIERAEKWKADKEDRLADWLTNPPDTILFQPQRHGYPSGEPIVMNRPIDYDTHNNRCWTPRTYDAEFKSLRNRWTADIKNCEIDLEFMHKRVQNWKGI